MIARELRLALTALMFLTRIPVPAWVGHSETQLKQSARYFPLAGLAVGAISALAYVAAASILPHAVAVALALIAAVLATGAFHEDGFADTCDGLGGGQSREEALRIMQDPRVGAYGAIGIVLVLILRFVALASFAPVLVAPVLLAGHAASRFYPVLLIRLLPYARVEGGKSKSFAGSVGTGEAAIALAIGLAPLAALFPPRDWLAFLPPLAACAWLAQTFRVRLGGYTGDCLGATQQVCEIVFYLSLLVLAGWKLS